MGNNKRFVTWNKLQLIDSKLIGNIIVLKDKDSQWHMDWLMVDSLLKIIPFSALHAEGS